MSASTSDTLHIVEPTLRNEAGHCHSLIASLAACKSRPSLVVWADKQFRPAQLALLPKLKIEGVFSRRLRKIQAFFLYRKLLKQPGKIFISTAGRTDLQLMDWAAGKCHHANKIFFYVHWLALSADKKQQLKKIAERRPEFTLLTTTQTAADHLLDCGFISVRQIPYPVSASAIKSGEVAFRYVLVPGAARQDKGISQAIDYIEYLVKSASSIPLLIQTSGEHYGKLDAQTHADLQRLDTIEYAPLIRQRDTLTVDDYNALYPGAICLQPYDPIDFADRVSGVTLDALRAGAPVIATDRTWMANIIKRFDAGEVLPERNAASIHAAVEKICARYDEYQANARRAGQALDNENSAQHLMDALTTGL
jgi:glycosyltransferase involved in cell wall biosynthesis